MLSEALTAARSIEDSSARAQALGELAPHLPAELLSEALTAARSIEDGSDRARALGELAPHLPEPASCCAEALTAPGRLRTALPARRPWASWCPTCHGAEGRGAVRSADGGPVD